MSKRIYGPRNDLPITELISVFLEACIYLDIMIDLNDINHILTNYCFDYEPDILVCFSHYMNVNMVMFDYVANNRFKKYSFRRNFNTPIVCISHKDGMYQWMRHFPQDRLETL